MLLLKPVFWLWFTFLLWCRWHGREHGAARSVPDWRSDSSLPLQNWDFSCEFSRAARWRSGSSLLSGSVSSRLWRDFVSEVCPGGGVGRLSRAFGAAWSTFEASFIICALRG